jgi:hypothetical protein
MYRLPTLFTPTLCVAALAALGCETPGERARTGECPPEEVCSDDTPDGLYFRGAPFAGSGRSVKRIAVGGTQSITVLEGRGDSGDRFVAPFDATISSPMLVDKVGPADLVVTAEEAGSAYLRINDPDTGELYDRVTVRSSEIDTLEISAHGYADEDARLFAQGRPVVVVRMTSEGGDRLVDEGIEFAADDADVSRDSWDLVGLSEMAAGEIDVVVTTSAGDEHARTFEVVDSIDTLERVYLSDDSESESEVAVDSLIPLCFEGRHDDSPVAGLDWAWEAIGPLEVHPSTLVNDGCVLVEGLETGAATLVVTAGGLELSVELEVVEAPPARLFDPIPHVEESPATPGARASR